MKRETGVLQDRIKIAALKRRVDNAEKRIGGNKNEQMKGSSDPGLHCQRIGFERDRQISAKDGDQRAEQSVRMKTHSIMEPSWFPQTLVSRYINGIAEFEFS